MINTTFKQFIDEEVLPLTKLEQGNFWASFEKLIEDFSPRNASLLQKRLDLQSNITQWHKDNPGSNFDPNAYKLHLDQIGYIVKEGPSFTIETENVDQEIASIAGPQLVVPLKNARFALNAANARWGSFYDALYGSDIIDREGEVENQKSYDPVRGAKVIAYGRKFLDEHFPLDSDSHSDATGYRIENGILIVDSSHEASTTLKDAHKLIGYSGSATFPSSILLKNNGLHVEIKFDGTSNVGSSDKASICDIFLEAAITTIMDCEDSVAAVDCEDKIEVYKNWLGLMTGSLSSSFVKGTSTTTRQLNEDKEFLSPEGKAFTVASRSLLFNRNVGLLMTTNLMTDADDNEVPENIIDAVVISLGSMIDLQISNGYQNSKTGSIYIVKPKMHGPEEVAFTCDLFSAVENLLDLPENTIKLGIMDEERRTTINLKECIRQAKQRLVFINTGFLDRTGDEISTSMEAGPFLPKGEIKNEPWIEGYENQNVDIGLACGLSGKAQIGKGMWAMPDEMLKMINAKIQHPKSGANTAWVPSPTAAVLHATHYHQVNVFEVHDELRSNSRESLDSILKIPLLKNINTLSEADIHQELENNLQGILGYVVRWVESGIGCSKVPDIHDIELMEDRATLRISAIHIANWLHHGICSSEDVEKALEKMAQVVDRQNSADPLYKPMSQDFESSLGFKAAKALIFDNSTLPNGYTEPLLHQYRVQAKAL